MRDEYGHVADLYDHVPVYRNRADLRFFIDAARESGGPVLELGCGTGRVLIPIARSGIDIVGIDSSLAMLDVCRRNLRDLPAEVAARVRLVQADIRDFDLEGPFALVTIPFRPFQHLLSVEDQLSCLASIRRHLADRGTLVLDVFNPLLEAIAKEPAGEEIPEAEFTAPDGRRVSRSHRMLAHDRFAQINDIELIYDVTHPDGRRERLVHAFRMRYFFRYEMEHLLARAGFEVRHLYAGYDRSAFGSTYPGELVFVAARR